MEQVAKKTVRDGKIEIIRFLAAVIIMNGHAVSLGFNSERPFMYGWIYVEFFFIVTGFFTAGYFSKKNSNGYPGYVNILKVSAGYTVSKFIPFLAYTIIPVIITYVFRNLPFLSEAGKVSFINRLTRLPAELLYLSEASPHGTLSYPLWFLSAMFIALPFICIILNIKIVKLDLFIAVGYCAFYYQIADFGLIALPNTIFRAFGGMCLGIIIWHFTEWIRVKTIRFPLRVMITVIEVFTFILPLFISFMNYSMRDFQLICFILWMAAIQSGQSLIPKINSSFFIFLGKLSMPIYVWHFAVICIINYFLPNAQMGLKIALFWILTFVIGLANLIIVDSIKNSKKKQPV